jgi:hypothetical protein
VRGAARGLYKAETMRRRRRFRVFVPARCPHRTVRDAHGRPGSTRPSHQSGQGGLPRHEANLAGPTGAGASVPPRAAWI